MFFYRLVQLTDLHISSDPNTDLNGLNARESFMSVLDQAMTEAPDYFLLTGDIAVDDRAYAWVRQIMQNTKTAWSWLPGNHDVLELMQNKFVRKVCLGPWRLLQLNSRVSGCSYGRLSTEEIVFLQAELDEDSVSPTLVMLHHHVCNIGSCLDDGRVDSTQLFECLTPYSCVKAIVHGHIHQEWESTEAHIQVLGAPSTCVQFLPGASEFLLDCQRSPGYRLFDLSPEGEFYSEIRRLTGERFVVASSKPVF